MKIALGIEYNGTHYFGWQRQRDVKSVQEELEKALSVVANHPVEVMCAGRTDAGVHGTGQSFTLKLMSIVKWWHGLWALMPICRKISLFVGRQK